MSQIDVYTGEPIVTETAEHIIPSFLGGRLKCRGIIDKSTNDRFGHGIDASLHRAIQAFLVVADARGDRTSKPPRLSGIGGEDGRWYDVDAGGIVRPQPRPNIEAHGSSISIDATAVDTSTLKQALSKWAQRNGHNPEEIVERALAMAQHTTSPSPKLTFKHDLFETDCYRAVAKMACNLLALRNRSVFMHSSFDLIRDWVLGRRDLQAPLVQLVEYEAIGDEIGELDHLVRVAPASDGRVEGLVLLFGTFAFSVDLGERHDVEPFASCYRVDQLGRQDRADNPNDLRIIVPRFHEAAAVSFEVFAELAQKQTLLLAEKVQKIQRRRWIERTIKSCLVELGVKPGECIETDIDNEKFAMCVAAKIAAGVAHGSYSRARSDQMDEISANAGADGDDESA